MQRVLAEVTDHMEQQYTAHRYLEKLRTENEGIAIKEKERMVRKNRNYMESLKRILRNKGRIPSHFLKLLPKTFLTSNEERPLCNYK